MSGKPSEAFIVMAKRIDLNAETDFGGAFVIVPPGANAEPVQMLILDPGQNATQFWGTLLTRAQIALKDIEDQQRRGVYGS